MTLREHYEQAKAAGERESFLAYLAAETGNTASTALQWCLGHRHPAPAALRLIAQALNTTENELFKTQKQ